MHSERSPCTDLVASSQGGEVGQRKGCTFKARLLHAGKPASKLNKRGYIFDCTDLFLQAKERKLVSAKAALLKHIFSTLEYQPVSLINEATSLTSMDESSVKLTSVGEPDNPISHWQRKWITDSSFLAYLHPRQNSLNGSRILPACLPITQWPALWSRWCNWSSWQVLESQIAQ